MRLIIMLLAFASMNCLAQVTERIGMITLVPYIPEDVEMDNVTRQYLLDKLSQIAIIGGGAGQGIDNRFVITANVRVISKTMTATIPQKTALRISFSLYIGDGIEGTLFATANKEVTGIGKEEDDAYITAIRKLPTNDRAFVSCVNEGKKRIIEYYDKISGSVISSAKTLAAMGDNQGAINKLFTIPMQCVGYEDAQDLIADISRQYVEQENLQLLNKARSAWGASPNSQGAETAYEHLSRIQYPSPDISSGIKQLCLEMSNRLAEIDNQEWKRQMKAMQNRHESELAQIESQKQRSIAYVNAAASVAKAYVANRPRIIYRIYQWW